MSRAGLEHLTTTGTLEKMQSGVKQKVLMESLAVRLTAERVASVMLVTIYCGTCKISNAMNQGI